jgi:hypothetical protein
MATIDSLVEATIVGDNDLLLIDQGGEGKKLKKGNFKVDADNVLDANGGSVQDFIDNIPKKIVSTYAGIDEILTSTTGDIAIELPVGRFKSPDPVNLREGVYIFGSGCPDNTADRLIGGTILEGRYHSYNIKRGALVDLGVDCGAYTISEGKAVESDAIVVSNYAKSDGTVALGSRLTGWTLLNVIGMCKTPTTAGHAVLLEGLDPPCIVDNISGVYSNTPVVLKCGPIQVGKLRGVGAFFAGVLLKSNSYDAVTGTQVSQTLAQALGGYGAGTLIEADDADVNGVHIAQVCADPGCDWLFRTSTAGASTLRASVGSFSSYLTKQDAVTIDGAGVLSFKCDSHMIRGAGHAGGGSYTGVKVTAAAGDNNGVNLGDGFCDNCSGNGYSLDGFARLGYVNAENNGQFAIYSSVDYELQKLKKFAGNGSGVFGGTMPRTSDETILAPLTPDSGVAYDTSIRCHSLTRVAFAGQIGSPPVTPVKILTLDVRYRPVVECRIPVVCITGGTFSTESLLIQTGGNVILEKSSATDTVILSGVDYSII